MTIVSKGVSLVDLIEVPSERQITDSGQMIVPCAFARTGEQVYSAGQLGLTGVAADKPITVMRDEADVFDEASLSSFRSVPVTIGHPVVDGVKVPVNSENSKELQVGVLEGMPTRDEDTLTGTLVIARQDAIDLIEDGTKELSAGYTCDLEMVDQESGEPVIYQRNIRANHIAIVERGRAGSSCSIADEAIDESKTKVVPDETEEPSSEVLDEASESKDGGDGIGKHDNKEFSEEAISAGVKVEMEHTDSEEVARSIAKDHLAEDPEYYSKLAVMESGSDTQDEAEAEEKSGRLADEAVSETVNLEDELETAKTSLAALTIELTDSLAKVVQLQDQIDNSVEERVNTILVAKDLTDLEDFSGKSVDEIKHMVVADQMPNLNLEGKSEAYVCARFDVLTEDAEIGETPMGKLLRDNASASHFESAKPSNLVEDARARATDRHKNRGKDAESKDPKVNPATY